MPLYEYRCVQDGTLLTLLRPMREADDPVEDPEGLPRTWERVQSLFSVESTDPPRQEPSGGCCGGGCGCGGR